MHLAYCALGAHRDLAAHVGRQQGGGGGGDVGVLAGVALGALASLTEGIANLHPRSQVGLYTILSSPIMYGVWHSKEGSLGGVYRAMDVQSG